MGSNHMHEVFKNSKQKFPIPEYDPQTGERNPHYEELTGKVVKEHKSVVPEGSDLDVLNKWLRMLADADVGIRRKLVWMNRFRDAILKKDKKGD